MAVFSTGYLDIFSEDTIVSCSFHALQQPLCLYVLDVYMYQNAEVNHLGCKKWKTRMSTVRSVFPEFLLQCPSYKT